MEFHVLERYGSFPSGVNGGVRLSIDRWDDFGFETQFYLSIYNENGERLAPIGDVKIGRLKQENNTNTRSFMDAQFTTLDESFFSVGQSVEYYKNLRDHLSESQFDEVLVALRDIVYTSSILKLAEPESVFSTSLLRSVSINAIKGQFTRVVSGQALLTPYDFSFNRLNTETFSKLELDFKVSPYSQPRTNIHAIIGRNGVGKTTLLNGMIGSITNEDKSSGSFYCHKDDLPPTPIDSDYFSSVVSVSFSAFDPFNPPQEQSDPLKGTCYYYIGLKDSAGDVGVSSLKTLEKLREELVSSLGLCFSAKDKRSRWIKAIKTLESDVNFSEMSLRQLALLKDDDFKDSAIKIISKMSSGHAIVLLTITRLIEKVEEKTLVLIDEPEGHLHPPLLAAFIRALSDLLFNRNGVAIIATHSPVILQEIPRSCAWKITRFGKSSTPTRPKVETFGENVGVLTREVFGLEVEKSGFHALLESSVEKGGTFESIFEKYNGQLGFEGQVILRSMVAIRAQKVVVGNE
jgi:predicted ATPase